MVHIQDGVSILFKIKGPNLLVKRLSAVDSVCALSLQEFDLHHVLLPYLQPLRGFLPGDFFCFSPYKFFHSGIKDSS